MPADYVLPTTQNTGQSPTIYTGVGPALVPFQTYAPAGSFLRVDGNWAMPGSQSQGVIAKSASFAASTTQGGEFYNVTTGSSAIVVTLPAANAVASGFDLTVRKTDTGAGTVSFTPTPGPGATELTFQGQTVRLVSDATNWYSVPYVGVVDGSGNYTLANPVKVGSITASGNLTSGGVAAVPQHLYVDTAVVAQAPIAATRTYITGSAVGPFTAGSLAVGTVFRWKFDATKTGAGTATSTIDIAVGTAGTTADGATISFTKPAGTGVIDEAWFDIEVVVKTLSATVGVISGVMRMVHNLSATGHAQIPVVVVQNTYSTLNTTTPTYFGVCITTGASDAITINQCTAESINL